MSNLSDAALAKIGDAALVLFSRHGYQKTSMADVARTAKISRATLYLRFRDKTALFEHLARRVADEALAAVHAAWAADADLQENICRCLLAKDLPLYRLLHASPHGAELLAVDADVTREHAERLDAGFASFLTRQVRRMRDADLAAFGGAVGFGRFIAVSGAGLKHEARSEDEYLAAVKCLARVAARAATPRGRRSAP